MNIIMGDQGIAEIELIAPTKQKEWGWPAVANFTLGGAGAGFYLFTVLIMIFTNPNSAFDDPIPYWMMGPVFVGSGFLCLTIEAGRPLRSPYLIRQLGKAWISKEILAFTFFTSAVILDFFFPHLIFKAFAALSALFFMVAQGFIIYSSRAVPAWNLFIMPIFFLSSGFASAAGLALILAASGRLLLESSLALLSMTCIILNLTVWVFYLWWPNSIDFRSATARLHRPFIMLFTIVFGHAFPILMLLLFQILPFPEMGTAFPGFFAAISGLAIIISVVAQKAGIVLSSGFTGKITLSVGRRR
jgi:DMSO reductase anchor subunit